MHLEYHHSECLLACILCPGRQNDGPRQHQHTGAIAAEAAYNGAEQWLDDCLAYIRGNMEYVQEYAAKHMPDVGIDLPEATYLLWMDFSKLGVPQEELVRLLLNEAGLALNDGTVFGSEGTGYMRMNVACPRSTVEEAMRRLSLMVNQLNKQN